MDSSNKAEQPFSPEELRHLGQYAQDAAGMVNLGIHPQSSGLQRAQELRDRARRFRIAAVLSTYGKSLCEMGLRLTDIAWAEGFAEKLGRNPDSFKKAFDEQAEVTRPTRRWP